MHLKPRYLNGLINLFLGVAWAFSFIGFISGILSSYPLFDKIVMAVLQSLPGLFAVLVLEYIFAGFARLEILKEQKALLEKRLEKESSESGTEEEEKSEKS